MTQSWFKRHNFIKKAISIFSLTIFIVTIVLADAWAAIETSAIPYNITRSETTEFASLNVKTFSIPAHLASTGNVFKGSGDKIIINILDAHCNKFAQHKVSRILDYLNAVYGVSMINLEGGVGGYDLSPFSVIKNRSTLEKVSDHFIDTGQINGAEYYAVNNKGRVTLWGAEDEVLYLSNLKVYRGLVGYKDEVEQYLGEFSHILNRLKRQIYSRELLKIDMVYSSYKTGNTGLKQYLDFLFRKAEKHEIKPGSYQNLFLLAEGLEVIDESRIPGELDNLESELKEKMYRNRNERRLNMLSRNLTIMRNIFNLRLIRDDHKYYVDNVEAFNTVNFLDFIDKEAPKYNISDRTSPMISNLDIYRKEVAKFYDYSFKRDMAFIQNMRFSDIRTESPDISIKCAVIMTGGFHADNLERLCREQKISYISIWPNFDSYEDYKNPYFGLLAGELPEIEKVILPIISEAMMMQVASLLNPILAESVYSIPEIYAFRSSLLLHKMIARGNRVAIVDDLGQTIQGPQKKPLIFGENYKPLKRLTANELLELTGFKKIESKIETTVTAFNVAIDSGPPVGASYLQEDLLNRSWTSDPDKETVFDPMLAVRATGRNEILVIGEDGRPHYKTIGLLGKGATSRVFEALDLDTRRILALKMLTEGVGEYPRRRFEKEVNINFILRNKGVKGVVKIESGLEVLEYEDVLYHYFVMERIEGGESLRSRIKSLMDNKNKMTIEELQINAVDIVSRIARALRDIHKAGILHKDVKPGNVIITPEMDVKFIDFGIAEELADNGKTIPVGGIVGTPEYMSPEQILDEPLGPASDIYSLGLILFELCKPGQHILSDGENIKRMKWDVWFISNILNGVVESRVKQRTLDLDHRVSSLISDLVATNPEDRIDSVSLIRRLETIKKALENEIEVLLLSAAG